MVNQTVSTTATAPPTNSYIRGTSKSKFSGLDSFADALEKLGVNQKEDEDDNRNTESAAASYAASQQRFQNNLITNIQTQSYQSHTEMVSTTQSNISQSSQSSNSTYETNRTTQSQNNSQNVTNESSSADVQDQSTTGTQNQTDQTNADSKGLVKESNTVQNQVQDTQMDLSALEKQLNKATLTDALASSASQEITTEGQTDLNSQLNGSQGVKTAENDQATKAVATEASSPVVQAQENLNLTQINLAQGVAPTSTAVNTDTDPEIQPVTEVSATSGAQTNSISGLISGSEMVSSVATQSITSEPARLSEARGTQILSQVTQAVQQMSRTSQNSVRLQLFPQDLGKIDLQVSQTANGLKIVIHADQDQTGKILETNLDNLRQSLQEAGVQLSQLSVGQQGSQQQSGYQDRDSQSSNQRRYYSENTDAVDLETETVNSPRLSTSLVDYQV